MKRGPDVSQPIVLYVDDNGDDLFLAEHTARRTHPPFTLALAVGTEGIIEYFARDSDQLPAMVIVDYMLAHSCAPDLIRWLHDEPAWAHIPVVVLSGRRSRLRRALLRQRSKWFHGQVTDDRWIAGGHESRR